MFLWRILFCYHPNLLKRDTYVNTKVRKKIGMHTFCEDKNFLGDQGSYELFG